MPGLASVREHIRRSAAKHDIVIVHDVFGLLEPTGLVDGAEVVVYKTPLAFRRHYEPLRYAGAKVVVLVQAENAFIPDIETRVQSADQVVSVTPHSALVTATKDASWPQSVNQFGKLVLNHLDSIVKLHKKFRERVKVGFSDSDACRVVLSGITNVTLTGNPSPQEVWSLYFLKTNTVSELEREFPVLMDELRECVRSLGEPVKDLVDGDAETTARAVWTARILLQHLPGALAFLPNLSPDYFAAQNWQEKTIKELTDAVYETEGGLAAEQVADAERTLTPEAVEAIGKKLGLSDTARAIHVASEERLSPLLLDLALRYILSELPAKPNLLSSKSLVDVVESARKAIIGVDNPYAALIAVRPDLHDLLRLLVDLFDIMSITRDAEPKVKELASKAPNKPKPFVDLFSETPLYRVDLLASRIGRLVTDTQRTKMLPEPVSKNLAVMTADRVGKALGEAKGLLGRLNEIFADVVKSGYPKWVRGESDVPFVVSFMPDTVVPHCHKKGKAYILIFDGMRWDAWMEYVRPEMERRFDLTACSPILAVLPTSTGHSRRSLFSGKYPEQFKQNDAEDNLLATAWKDGPAKLETTKDESDEIALRMYGDGAEVIVFSFTDAILHKFDRDFAYLYEEHVKKIVARDVRRVLEDIPEDAVVFVSADHGFVELEEHYTVIPPECSFDPSTAEDIKWRYSLLVQEFRAGSYAASFSPSELRVPESEPYFSKQHGGATKHYKEIVLATGNSFIRRKGQGGPVPRFWHGGISLQEMVVPCAVLTRKPAVDMPRIETIGLEGADKDFTAGTESEIRLKLVLKGPLTTQAVEVTSTPAMIPAKTEVLQKDEPKEVVLPFTPSLADGVGDQSYLVKIQVKTVGSGKLKLPPPRPVKLHVIRDSGKLERETSSVLDDMFKKK